MTEDVVHVRSGAAPGPRSKVNKAVLWAGCISYVLECTVAASLASFFPRYAERHTGGTLTQVGLVFAALPLSIALASPLMSWCMKRVARPTLVYVGLAVEIVGLVGFSRSNSIKAWVAWRCLQGLASAMIDVPLLAMLMSYTNDVAEDTGLLEAMAGLSYTVAPVLGGALYQTVGFRRTFEVFAVIHLVALLVFPAVLRSTHAGELKAVAEFYASEPTVTKELKTKQPILSVPAVQIAMGAFLWSNASLSFYDTALSGHAHATLSLSPVAVGLTYLAPALAYAAISPFAGKVVRRFGARDPLMVGCVLWFLGCVAWGPVPLNLGRGYVWACLGVWSTFSGVAIALIFQTPLPLARHFCGRDKEEPVILSPSVEEETEQVEASNRRRHIDDTLAAAQQGSGAAGQVIGPLLGGLIVDRAPQLREPGCELGDYAKCHSGFFWASSMFGVVFLVLVPVLLCCVRSDRPSKPTPTTDSEEPLLVGSESPLSPDFIDNTDDDEEHVHHRQTSS